MLVPTFHFCCMPKLDIIVAPTKMLPYFVFAYSHIVFFLCFFVFFFVFSSRLLIKICISNTDQLLCTHIRQDSF